MAEVFEMVPAKADRFPTSSRSAAISEEFFRMTSLIRGALPEAADVSFTFDGRLQVHIDVRKREDVTLVELVLPNIEPGLFEGANRGRTPGHPFHHRVTAYVRA